jgi:hypothetical protein
LHPRRKRGRKKEEKKKGGGGGVEPSYTCNQCVVSQHDNTFVRDVLVRACKSLAAPACTQVVKLWWPLLPSFNSVEL